MRRQQGAARLVVLVVAPAIVLLLAGGCGPAGDVGGSSSGAAGAPAPGAGDAALAKAFADRASDLEVEGDGTVARLLPDDEEGGRHQRFIVRLASGQTLLVAHNIDVAPRVEGLEVGETIAFRGVYEWSSEGGTIHWTHHDPSGDHASGWLRHSGRVFE
jgi:hypothetical protein